MIVRNAERTLDTALASLVEFAEVVVYDNGSTDGTAAKAAAWPNVVLRSGPFAGFGPTKNAAIRLARHDWVLAIDAGRGRDARADGEHPGWRISTDPAQTFPCTGATISWGARSVTRAGPTTGCCGSSIGASTGYDDALVHEKVRPVPRGRVLRLEGSLRHDAVAEIGDFLVKVNRYSEIRRQQPLRVSSTALILLRSLWAFFRTLVLRRGFLDGWRGAVIAVSDANGVFFKFMKPYADERLRRERDDATGLSGAATGYVCCDVRVRKPRVSQTGDDRLSCLPGELAIQAEVRRRRVLHAERGAEAQARRFAHRMRPARSEQRSASALASAGASPGGTTRPDTPSTTSSALPPVSVTIGATPSAIASITVLGRPSRRTEGSTETSQAATSASTSSRNSKQWMRSRRPAASMSAASAGSVMPRPTSRKCASTRGGRRPAASISTGMPLRGRFWRHIRPGALRGHAERCAIGGAHVRIPGEVVALGYGDQLPGIVDLREQVRAHGLGHAHDPVDTRTEVREVAGRVEARDVAGLPR